ncbi:hypothetical protein B0H19DRAFT_384388 [Mycena capillaripes]|nr:hypothetical protein B0H19DRAFT_384388 [Mycena capillaripes]
MSTELDPRVCETCSGTSFKNSALFPDATFATELRGILRSNDVPSATTAASLRDVIRRAPAELGRYDAEIKRVQNILAGLISDRVDLEHHFEA